MISFFVDGNPAPGGSKRSFISASTRRVVTIDDAKGNRAWKERVAFYAAQAMGGRDPLVGPLRVVFTFHVRRPKGHYGTGRNSDKVRDSAPEYPATKPDVTKFVRAAEDACTGIVWHDDAQVVEQHAYKRYGKPGVEISVGQIGVDKVGF